MKRKIIIIVLAIVLAFGIFLLIRRIEWIAVFPPKGFSLPRPSIWVSDNPQLYFSFTGTQIEDEGLLYDEDRGKFVEIMRMFNHQIQDFSINLTTERPSFLFSGKPENRKNDSFIITVTHSFVSYVEVGDVITFYQLDELPEWAMIATEILEETN